MKTSVSSEKQYKMKQYDKAIVVLTNGMYKDDKRTCGWKPDIIGHTRIAAASLYYLACKDNGINPCLIVSGGKIDCRPWENKAPALCMPLAEDAIDKYGIRESCIYLEDKSVDTSENVINSAEILKKLGFEDKITLITSRFHMPRSSFLFREQGYKVNERVAEDVLRDQDQELRLMPGTYSRLCAFLDELEDSSFYRNLDERERFLYKLTKRFPKLGPLACRMYVHSEILLKGKRPSCDIRRH